MSLNFSYYFDDKEEPYYYEAYWKDAQEYIFRTHDIDDVLRDYIDSGLYDKLGSEGKETLKTYDGFNGTYDSIDRMSEDTKKELADELILDLLDDTNIYDDELKDYFEQTAYDDYDNTIEHNRRDDDWFNR